MSHKNMLEIDDSKKQLSSEELQKMIDDFYRPQQLTNAILQQGEIPDLTEESIIGIAFLDIVDYSYISRYLTPKENLIFLNGLYTAFHNIIIKRQGYLNKIEGDGMMFHFGGPLDYNVKNMNRDDQKEYIARELFYTCIEIQRACAQFNWADEKFIENSGSDTQKQALVNAFSIIKELRTIKDISNQIAAYFQIRIRIGASIGEVTIGNTGPPGAKQWDVIGNPVIEAKRMESTAPVGGLRISQSFYNILKKHDHTNAYCNEFRRDAQVHNSNYQDILNTDIFRYQKAIIRHKKNVSFDTYSIQVDSCMPTHVTDQILALVPMQPSGAEKAVEIILNNRGNSYVVKEIETQLRALGIDLHKDELLRIIFKKEYDRITAEHGKNTPVYINKHFSLASLFSLLGQYQDLIDNGSNSNDSEAKSINGEVFEQNFDNYLNSMDRTNDLLSDAFENQKYHMLQKAYFYNFVFPMIKISLQNSILEYQRTMQGSQEFLQSSEVSDEFLEELEEMEAVE